MYIRVYVVTLGKITINRGTGKGFFGAQIHNEGYSAGAKCQKHQNGKRDSSFER